MRVNGDYDDEDLERSSGRAGTVGTENCPKLTEALMNTMAVGMRCQARRMEKVATTVSVRDRTAAVRTSPR